MRSPAAAVLLLLASLACGRAGDDAAPSEGAGTAPAETDAAGSADLAARGRSVYQSACTACHAPDPARPGPIGPEIAGSSLELLRAKVLRNEYPPGYAPKRDTRAMVPLPHVEPDLTALAAYLREAAGG
jgi:mono/diheme cytochrome c family protein